MNDWLRMHRNIHLSQSNWFHTDTGENLVGFVAGISRTVMNPTLRSYTSRQQYHPVTHTLLDSIYIHTYTYILLDNLKVKRLRRCENLRKQKTETHCDRLKLYSSNLFHRRN